ncbi:uncharacterized protein LOC114076786 [Solanum pennellii]|uniref:Uncharacterized protein LOC114076786 n=1 Tax=Solanum pennellii TaxID=28526 RepID=A0ABM1V8M3_SOLPN|nr:uncharacterized protein LOC114076786 [Solanum pennellii]
MNSLRISDTEANSDDFHNDDFEDFDYSLEEDDMLFSKYIDPSAESFGININQRHEKNDENQDYINEKMQNVEGDSDCVDSDDIESLNGDCDSENEDSNFPKHNPKTDALNPKLELGMIFSNNKEFKEAVIANQAKIGKSIEWIKVDKRKARAKCRKMDVTGEYWVHRCKGTHIFKSRRLPPIILVLGGIITTKISLPVGLQRGMLIELDQIRIGKIQRYIEEGIMATCKYASSKKGKVKGYCNDWCRYKCSV